MYLQRKIDSYLKQWKTDSQKKPLIIKGPRQVGKTESILHFAKTAYESIIYINFVEEPKYRMIVEDGYNVNSIVKNISRIDPSKQFIAGKTILVFDELQEFPEIATALKFFAIDGRFDVVCSGSLLGISYKRIESNSVGYKTDYELYSLDFEEFLIAKGYQEDFIEEIYVWVFFSVDASSETIKTSIRSRGPIINEIASHYNGGGHIYASGARLRDFEQVDSLIQELDEACLKYKEQI